MKHLLGVYSLSPLTLAIMLTPSVGMANEERLSIEEVVVTAQRREQGLQDVPISVQALSQDQLEQSGVVNVSDIANLTPGLSFSSTSTTYSSIGIRGVATNTLSVGVEQSTALYLDGVYLGRGFDLIGDLQDIQQIEVLRGPQGTLFGRNAAAGAVNVTTAAPSDEFSGKVKVGYGSYDAYTMQGLINAPLTDSLLLRVNASRRNRDGWMENLTPGGEDFAKQDRSSFRAKLTWLASDNLTGNFTADYYRQDDIASVFVVEEAGQANTVGPAVTFPITGTGELDKKSAVNQHVMLDSNGNPVAIDPELKRDTLGLTAKFDWNLSEDHSITSVTSYRTSDSDLINASSGLQSLAPGFALANFVQRTEIDNKEFNQELRFSSAGEVVNWFVGFNYFYNDLNQKRDMALPVYSVLGVPATYAPGVLKGTFGDELLDIDVETNSWALFGDAIFSLSDALNLSVGMRYSHDTKEVTYNATNPRAPLYFTGSDGQTVIGGFDASNKADWDDLSGRMVLDYAFSDDVTAYAGVSQGYKSGGFNTNVAPGQDPGDTFDKEKATNYEVGFKSTWLDSRLRINGAVFMTDYASYQLQASDPNRPGVALNITADAQTRGAELDLTFLATESLTLSLSTSYLDTEFTEAAYSDFNPQPTVEKGQDMLRAPAWSTVLTADYRMPVGDVYELRVNTNYSYTESQRLSNNIAGQFTEGTTLGGLRDPALVFDDSDLSSGSYGILNARISLAPVDELWSLSIWGTNLTNEVYRDNTDIDVSNSVLRTLGGSVVPAMRNEPVMYGIDFTYNFGG